MSSLGVVCFLMLFEEGSGWSSVGTAMVLTPNDGAGTEANGFSTCFTVNEADPSGVAVLGLGAVLHKKLWKG
jgi:hypothetical protein